MASFRYDILVRKTVKNRLIWFLASDPSKNLGANVLVILNKMGEKGWEVVGSGDFGGDSHSEIILKHQTS